MKTRPGICARKRRFRREDEAMQVAAAAQVTLRVYRCALCREWHLTSRTKGMRLPPGPEPEPSLLRRNDSLEGAK